MYAAPTAAAMYEADPDAVRLSLSLSESLSLSMGNSDAGADSDAVGLENRGGEAGQSYGELEPERPICKISGLHLP